MSSPEEYTEARRRLQSSSDSASGDRIIILDGYPYLPNVHASADSISSIKQTALAFFGNEEQEEEDEMSLEVTKVSGGITNQLFKVEYHRQLDEDAAQTEEASGTNNKWPPTPILLRIFGAEGFIDRDVENATYAALSRKGLAPTYYGRFGNGRLESFLDTMRPLSNMELPEYRREIASALGRLHASFSTLPSTLEKHHRTIGLWKDLRGWMESSLQATFDDPSVAQQAEALALDELPGELKWLQESVVPADAEKVFCHNDLLAANILVEDSSRKIQLIDFEYGTRNYLAFDIANHFNEYAGGTDHGVPDYSLFPTESQQLEFIESYLQASSTDGDDREADSSITISTTSVKTLHGQVQKFILVNHLYWGLWAVHQASTEGCEGFNYLLYATNRIQRYRCEKLQSK